MKNIIHATVIAIASISVQVANAQNSFSFSNTNQAYTRLSGATSLTMGQPWTSDSSYEAPIGFNFKMNGATISKVAVSAGNFVGASQGAAQSGFILAGTGLMDRSILLGPARKSDIRYQTTGNAGNRIFKLEVYNAGFEDEYSNYGELKDSISIQLWLYEGSNAAEFRYGPSMVNYFGDYFGPQMMCGFLKNMDTATLTFDKFYVVHGTPTSATLDSTTSFPGTKGLNAIPSNGTVFRFTPKGSSATGIGKTPQGELASVYPTKCNGTLFVSHSNAKPLNYTITDMTGRVVASGAAAVGKSAIDLSAVAPGAYAIRLVNDEANTYEAQQFIKL